MFNYSINMPISETIVEKEIPANVLPLAEEKRRELIECLADHDDFMADLFLSEQEPTVEQLQAAIRRATLSRTFTPVFMGSAFKNTAVQPLLDGVVDYLPHPGQRINQALNLDKKEAPVDLRASSQDPLVALAFKIEDTKYGQLTYVRVYQGQLRRGMLMTNMRLWPNGKPTKLSKLVRMHSNEMEEVQELGVGEIGAMFGVECASGDTFTDGRVNWTLTSMFVPQPVVSYALKPSVKDNPNFSKALQKFMREDPTFRVHIDPESKETIISGMGELHLDIYVERMKREYNCPCTTGKPLVAYRETIQERAPFNYTHKKQSGGAGQFGKVMGYIEPTEAQIQLDIAEAEAEGDEDVDDLKAQDKNENTFDDRTVGLNIPSQFIPSIEKGFREACEKGRLSGHPVVGCRFVLEDGQAHAVDSSDLAFRLAAASAFRETYDKCKPLVLEPIMSVNVTTPVEFQTAVMTQLNRRKGLINDCEVLDEHVTISADVPLNQMFGYMSDLRATTQGKGEFAMEYKNHQPMQRGEQEELMKKYQKSRQQEKDK